MLNLEELLLGDAPELQGKGVQRSESAKLSTERNISARLSNFPIKRFKCFTKNKIFEIPNILGANKFQIQFLKI